MTLRHYRLTSTLHNDSQSESVKLVHWDSNTLYSTRWQVIRARWIVTLRFYNYPLLYKMTSNAEPTRLWDWDSTNYLLLYTMTVKAKPVGLWRWDSTDYHLLYTMTVKAKTVGLRHWDSTDYPLLYTMTVKAKPVGLWHWDSTDYISLHDDS